MMMYALVTRSVVVPGLVPGIHAFAARKEDVDGRDIKRSPRFALPGHDGVSVAKPRL